MTPLVAWSKDQVFKENQQTVLGKWAHCKNMEMHDEKIRYSSFIFLQDVLSFLVKFFLSFPKIVKTVFHCSFPSQQNHEFTHVYPSLWTKSISSSCTFDFDQDPSFEPHDIKYHPCEPHETKVDNTSVPHSPVQYSKPIQTTSSTSCSSWFSDKALHIPS